MCMICCIANKQPAVSRLRVGRDQPFELVVTQLVNLKLVNLLQGIPLETHHAPKSVLEDLDDTWGCACTCRRLSTQVEAALDSKEATKQMLHLKKATNQCLQALQGMHDEPMLQHEQKAKFAY